MIAKRAKTGAKRQSGPIAGQERGGNLCARVQRCWLAGAAAVVVAVIALSIAPVAPAQQWSSSSSSSSPSSSASNESPAEIAQQREKAAEMRKAKKVKEDINVGTFYMHKGDYGAAISRLKEAVGLDPRSVKARLRLAESYDKQHNWSAALKTYRSYLRDFPKARDQKKIRKKVEKLSRKAR